MWTGKLIPTHLNVNTLNLINLTYKTKPLTSTSFSFFSESEHRRPDLSFWLHEITGSITGRNTDHSDIYEAVSSPSSAASASTVSPAFPSPAPSSPAPTSAPISSSSLLSVPSEQVASYVVPSASQINVDAQEETSSSFVHTPIENLGNISTEVEMSHSEKISEASPTCDAIEAAFSYQSTRDRSSSISETDCEESYSPEQTSLGERADYSIPSPLSLPPHGTDCASHFLAMEESLKSKLIVNIIQDEILDGSLRIAHHREQRMEPKSFTYANKPNFTSIPNPVKIFLPRHFSSQSCPTFSPFQTSTFSPFTMHAQKSPIVDGASGRKHYIVTDKGPGAHPSPYVSSQHLSNFSL